MYGSRQTILFEFYSFLNVHVLTEGSQTLRHMSLVSTCLNNYIKK